MRTIFFGGAFDPFHSEHRRMLLAAKETLNPTQIVIYPSVAPPHKTGGLSPFSVRAEMIRAGTADIAGVVLDDIENLRCTVNPTVEILPLLKEKYPSDEYYFLIGADSMIEFPSWIRPEDVAKEAMIAVAGRKGYRGLSQSVDYAEKTFNAKIVLIPFSGKDVSSSEIRASLSLGLEPQTVDDAIMRIIKQNGLYQEYEGVRRELSQTLSEKTYCHSVRSVLYGMKLRRSVRAGFYEVFLACLLHDCAKESGERMRGVPDAVAHQFFGAVYAKERYGINDEKILDAIRYHTTGRPDMSQLEKLVYCADMLESGRSFQGVTELRRLIEEDFEAGFFACVAQSRRRISEKGSPAYYLTEECYNSYNEKRNR